MIEWMGGGRPLHSPLSSRRPRILWYTFRISISISSIILAGKLSLSLYQFKIHIYSHTRIQFQKKEKNQWLIFFTLDLRRAVIQTQTQVDVLG